MRLKDALKEATATDIIKDLDKVKNDLIKKVDVLIAKKKKLYSDVDITTPMSADEKQLDKDIQSIFSQIQQLIQQKRSLKKESVNEVSDEAYKIHRFTTSGQDAAQNFIDDNNIDAKKLVKYLTPTDNEGMRNRYMVRDIIGGKTDNNTKQRFIKLFKESINEGREIKSIQNDLNKTIAALESEISDYKSTKGTPQEKKHIDNLKKLHPIKKKLEAELDMAVSGLYRDAELKIED